MRLGLLFLLCASALLVTPASPLGAQQDISNAQNRYNDALRAYRVALAERNRVNQLHEDALDELTRARPVGGARLNNALAAVQDLGFNLTRTQILLTSRAEDLRRARLDYLDRLQNRIAELSRLLNGPLLQAVRVSYDGERGDRQREAERVDVEGGGLEEAIRLRAVPNLVRSPLDLPADLLAKASLLDARVVSYNLQLEEIARVLRTLRDRERAIRSLQEEQRSLTSSGLDLLLGGRLGTLPGGGASAGQSQLTLTDQIAIYEDYQRLIEEYRDEARERANFFRAEAIPGAR